MPLQNEHSIKIASERKLMEVTGLNRSQIRARLAAFGQLNQQIQVAAQAKIQAEREAAGPEPIKIRDISMPPRGIQAGGEGQNRGGQPTSGSVQAYLAVEDGDTMRVALGRVNMDNPEFVD